MITDRSSAPRAFLSARELTVVCSSVLIVFAIGVALKLAGSRFAGGDAWKTGGDFTAFYVTGRILSERGAASLYDAGLQEQVNREINPTAGPLNRTFAYPPYIAALIVPIAHLPQGVALAIFMVAMLAVYAGSVALMKQQYGPGDRAGAVLLLVAALSFFPFIGYSWLGAQISPIGLAAFALALVVEDRGRLLASGAALSLAMYKPTLLLLVLPMLLVTGRFTQLAGVALGTAAQALLWLAIGGTSSVGAFVDEIRWTTARTTGGAQLFNPYRYVDLNAFFRLLLGPSRIASAVAVGVAVVMIAVLMLAWRRSSPSDRPAHLLAWAATLAWTPVVNLYMPFYDSILVVASGILATEAMRERAWRGWDRVAPAMIAIYVTPWFAEGVARVFRLQIYTLVLAAFGALLIVEANRKPV